jgi:NAD(P)-dependent dehydrogenase (short-subunit alcohol dehydrogenase family)
MKLENRTAIITGAGSGMGRAISILFAKEGANVVLSDLKKEGLDDVGNEISNMGGKAISVLCDVSKESDVEGLILATLENFGAIDILVNNAGIMDNFTPVDKVSNSLWDKVMAVNLNGPFYACRLVVPQMLSQGKGVIINVASIGGLFGSRAGAAYTASKHALIGLSKNIGFMYATQGIRCNVIAPGGVNTQIMKDSVPDIFGSERCFSGGVNMPRMGESEEIATAALFLASDDSSYVNGSVLTVDGGWTAY